MSATIIKMKNGNVISNRVNDIEDVNPKQYLLEFQTETNAHVLQQMLIAKDPIFKGEMPQAVKIQARQLAEDSIDHIASLELPNSIVRLFNEDLTKKQQVSLLKDISLEREMIASILLQAGEKGFLLSQYMFTGEPTKYKDIKLPSFIYVKDDGSIESTDDSELTEGQKKEVVITSNFVLARILKNEKHWHCFYQVKRGVSGLESGKFGSQPHLHYISDKFGFSLDDVIKGFKNGICPHSKVHIVIR